MSMGRKSGRMSCANEIARFSIATLYPVRGVRPGPIAGRVNLRWMARLDELVAERSGISRSQARALILEGRVRVNGAPATKAGTSVREEAAIEVERPRPFVSRGGEKLDRALSEFKIDVRGLRALDVGASTGGFTDCLLQRGAKHVVAVDVGYGQLDWELRNDPRVTV